MNSEIWIKLKKHYEAVSKREINSLFEDPRRFVDFSVETRDLFLDFSKTNIDRKTKNLLLDLLEESNVISTRKKLFSGAAINKSGYPSPSTSPALDTDMPA